MSIELPNLDDRTYRDLVEEALSMIPSHAPKWTNHNPSDPGITLIELFAYLSEMLIYRINRVTSDNVHTFLSLLNGPEWKSSGNLELRDELRQSVLQLRARYRAITREDYEWLTTEGFNKWLGQMREAEATNNASKLEEWWKLSQLDRDQENNRPLKVKSIQRAHCVVERNLELNREEDRRTTAPGHISMVVLPSNDEIEITRDEPGPQPTEVQRQVLCNYLGERRILTTRLHVGGPTYAPVSVEMLVARYPDVSGRGFASPDHQSHYCLCRPAELGICAGCLCIGVSMSCWKNWMGLITCQTFSSIVSAARMSIVLSQRQPGMMMVTRSVCSYMTTICQFPALDC